MSLPAIDIMQGVAKSESSGLNDKTVGRLLVDAGLIKLSDAEIIERVQNERNLRFGEAAVALGLVQGSDIVRMLASQFEYAYLRPGQGGFSKELIAAYLPFSDQVEALRKLRTQINLRKTNDSQKAIAIIGINQGDGCSYLAANLATVFSQLGEQTVLVDANLRNPRQHQIFNQSQRIGLADLLAGRCGMEAVTKIPELKSLSILPAGTVPPNPQELLSRPSFDVLLNDLAIKFNIIIIDNAPANTFADNQIISAKAKNALIVCRKNHTRSKDLLALRKQLNDARVNCIGAVLNEVS